MEARETGKKADGAGRLGVPAGAGPHRLAFARETIMLRAMSSTNAARFGRKRAFVEALGRWACAAALVGTFAARGAAADWECPLHPEEARVVKELLAREGREVVAAAKPPFSWNGDKKALADFGIDPATILNWAVQDATNPGTVLSVAHNKEGRALALSGNGPWLQNDTLRALAAMPELRSISIDHNGYLANHPNAGLYSGAGFDALAESRIARVRLTLGIANEGLVHVARLKNLRELRVFHSRVRADGLEPLRGHPGIRSFSLGEMGNIPAGALALIATLPNLTDLAFTEAFVAYAGGLEHLAPLAGRLKTIDLRMCLIAEGDLARLRAEHPGAEIKVSTPEEIAKGHIGVARKLAQIAPADLAAPLQAAIAALAAAK